MKKFFLCVAALALTLTGCKQQTAESEAPQDNNAAPSGLTIAYIQLDTLMSQYQLYKDYSEVLTRKGTNIQNTLAQKQQTLEKHVSAFQKKYEGNGFTTRDELERAQNNLQQEQNDLQALAERLNTEFNAEQARINEAARDSIQLFLKQYNKTKKYDYVLVKAGDNMLIANPKYDITNEVVKGLNKRYKGLPDAKKGLKKMGEDKVDK